MQIRLLNSPLNFQAARRADPKPGSGSVSIFRLPCHANHATRRCGQTDRPIVLTRLLICDPGLIALRGVGKPLLIVSAEQELHRGEDTLGGAAITVGIAGGLHLRVGDR